MYVLIKGSGPHVATGPVGTRRADRDGARDLGGDLSLRSTGNCRGRPAFHRHSRYINVVGPLLIPPQNCTRPDDRRGPNSASGSCMR